jgi:hypothetical protein
MPYNITINYQSSIADLSGQNSGSYLKVWVTSVTNFADTGVFVFQRQVSVPETGQRDAYFTNVASAEDMETLPLGEPQPADTTTVLFRHATFEAYFNSHALMLAALAAIRQDIAELSSVALLRQQYLGQTIIEVFGT